MRCPVPATLAVRTLRSRSITKRFTTTFSELALKESPPECTIRPPSGSLSTLPPTMGKAKYGRLAVGPSAAPVASTLTPASERAAAVSLSIFSQVFPPLSAIVLPLWCSALWAAVAESASTTSAAIVLANVTSAGALMPERPGEWNKLLVMVLMVMSVPPFSMVGRHDGHACCSYLGVSLEVNLLGPPLGLLHSLVEILVQLHERFWAISCSVAYALAERRCRGLPSMLVKLLYSLPRRSPDRALGEGGEKGIGQSDHFVMV